MRSKQENYLSRINCTRKDSRIKRIVRKQTNINHTVILIHYTSGFVIPIYVHLQAKHDKHCAEQNKTVILRSPGQFYSQTLQFTS